MSRLWDGRASGMERGGCWSIGGPRWRSGMACTLRLFVIARASRARIRLVRRRSRRKERLLSLLLTTAGARFPTLAIYFCDCSRIARSKLTSSVLSVPPIVSGATPTLEAPPR
jgi:hypothetical protein